MSDYIDGPTGLQLDRDGHRIVFRILRHGGWIDTVTISQAVAQDMADELLDLIDTPLEDPFGEAADAAYDRAKDRSLDL